MAAILSHNLRISFRNSHLNRETLTFRRILRFFFFFFLVSVINLFLYFDILLCGAVSLTVLT